MHHTAQDRMTVAPGAAARLVGRQRGWLVPPWVRLAGLMSCLAPLLLLSLTPVTCHAAGEAWVVTEAPYRPAGGGAQQVVLFATAEGAKAQVTRADASQASGAWTADRSQGWSGWEPAGGSERAAWLKAPWGFEAQVVAGGHYYTLAAQGSGLGLSDLQSLWAAVKKAFAAQVADGDVVLVHSRPPAELAAERWVADMHKLVDDLTASWWVKPGSAIKRAVICRDVDADGKPIGAARKFKGPLPTAWVVADLQVPGSAELTIVWYEGNKPVIRRNMLVSGNCTITGRIMVSGGAGLGVGKYAAELWIGQTKEARLEFLVEPPGNEQGGE